jgi:TetR/AcrR family transcriptional regulator, transcriptional repressor for nem operon
LAEEAAVFAVELAGTFVSDLKGRTGGVQTHEHAFPRCMQPKLLLDTFGDKRALFLKALKMYVTESIHSIIVELERPGSALSAVQNAIVAFAERKDLSSAEGCMGLNAIGEFGQRDADVTRISRKAARVLRQTLMRVLTSAKSQEEIDSDADLDGMADFFESTLAGIRIAAKAGKSRQALRNIAVFASRAYMASNCRTAPK